MTTLIPRTLSKLSRGLSASLIKEQVRQISVLVPDGTPDFPKRTSAEVVQHLTEAIVGGPAIYDPVEFRKQREALMDLLPKSQDELPPRRMSDSFDQVVIPLVSLNQ